MRLFENEKFLIGVLIALSAFLFFIGLGAMPLTDPDEVFYAQTAREMLDKNEYLTPYIFDEPQFEKPPLYYWLVIFSYRFLGVNEFAARFPSSLFGILGVIGVYLLGRVLVSKKTAFFAGLILATNINYIILARACVTDMALGVFILYAFLFFFYGYFAASGKTKWYLFSSIFLALAVLTKGPIGVFFPFVIIGLYLILTKKIKKITEIPLIKGALLLVVISVPWYFLMYKAHGKEFIDVFFGFHNIIRFLEPEHKIGDVFYYYIPVILAGFAPWSVFLPLGAWQMFREKEKNIRKTNLFLIIWIFVIFVFFSISRTKLATYIFPLFPALALIVARSWEVFFEKDVTAKEEKMLTISMWLFFILAAGAIVTLCVLTNLKYPMALRPSIITGAFFVPLMAISTIAVLRKKYLTGFVIFFVSFAALATSISYFVMPEIAKYESSKLVSEKLLEVMKPEEALGAETRYQRGVAFYTKRNDVLDVHKHHIITKFLDSPKRVWCVIKDKNHVLLYTDERTPYDKPTYVVYRIGKKVIVTNKIPPGVKYLKLRTPDEPY